MAPSPPVPRAILDLSAKQAGDGVLLTFTLPNKSTLGDRLQQVPSFEVRRGTLRPDGSPDPKSFRAVDMVPGSLVNRYTQHGQVQFVDPIAVDDAAARSGQPIVYRVRAMFTQRRPSPDSNDAQLKLVPVPAKIGPVTANVTERGIELSWAAPAKTSTGEPLTGPLEYHVYRGELDPASAPAADLSQAKWRAPLLQLGTSATPEYRDAGFDYGKTYAYIVRSTMMAPGSDATESSDSGAAILTPKDTFPPAAPQGIVAAVQPGAAPDSAIAELSWAINVETDLAGYRVYRSEQEGERGELLTPELLPSPAYRDTSVRYARHYWYTVTAVDRAGNESAPGIIPVDVAQPSR